MPIYGCSVCPATFDRMDDMFLHTSEHRLQAAETEKRLDLARGIPANHPIMEQHERDIRERQADLQERMQHRRKG